MNGGGELESDRLEIAFVQSLGLSNLRSILE